MKESPKKCSNEGEKCKLQKVLEVETAGTRRHTIVGYSNSETNLSEEGRDGVTMEEKYSCNKWEFHMGEHSCNLNTCGYIVARGHKCSRNSMPQEGARKFPWTKIFLKDFRQVHTKEASNCGFASFLNLIHPK